MPFLSRLRGSSPRQIQSRRDPAAAAQRHLDAACERQRDLLRAVEQGLIEVATARQRLQQHAQSLHQLIPLLEAQARRALDAGQEAVAAAALRRKQATIGASEELDRHLIEAADQERQLIVAAQDLAARVDALQTRRQIAAARFAAEEAEQRVFAALDPMLRQSSDNDRPLAHVSVRPDRGGAAAIRAIVEVCGLPLVPDMPDLLDAELRALAVDQAVDEELARLKQRIGPRGGHPPTESNHER